MLNYFIMLIIIYQLLFNIINIMKVILLSVKFN